MRLYMTFRETDAPAATAAKASFSTATVTPLDDLPVFRRTETVRSQFLIPRHRSAANLSPPGRAARKTAGFAQVCGVYLELEDATNARISLQSPNSLRDLGLWGFRAQVLSY